MKINLCLRADFWNKSPSVNIILDNKHLHTIDNFIDGKEKNVDFDADLDEGEHQLIIERTNKPIKDTVVDRSTIVKDSTIEILDLIIDKISIEPLLDKATYYPKYPEPWLGQQKAAGNEPPNSYNYCRTLYHEGQWKLNFTSPIHIWFFQNINVQI